MNSYKSSAAINIDCIFACRKQNSVAGVSKYYHGNKNLPVWLDTQDIVGILLEPNMNNQMLCSIQHLNVEHNTVFVVDLLKLKKTNDIFCDDMDLGSIMEYLLFGLRWMRMVLQLLTGRLNLMMLKIYFGLPRSTLFTKQAKI